MIPPLLENGRFPLGNYSQYKADTLNFWLDCAQAGPLVRVRFAHRELWVVTDAEMVQEMLQTKAKNYPRAKEITRSDGINTGRTVFNAPTWQEWLWRRRLLQPAFHRKQLATFAEAMVDETAVFMRDWQPGKQLPMKTAMKDLTMRIIGRTMFSAPLEQTDILQQCFEQVSEYAVYRSSTVVKLPAWLPLPLFRRTRWAVTMREKLVSELVEQRLASGQPQDDLLDMLIAANLEDGTTFSAQDIVHEMISIIFAGHETTSMTLTWLFYLLAQYPEVEARIRDEIGEVLNGRLPTLNDLPKMPYTNWVVQETMRLYPSVYVTIRDAIADDELGGYSIPAGTQFVVNIRGLHRDPRYWQQPERFDPERFDPPRHNNRPKGAYIPFLTGPRKCIGDSFAMMEMQLIVPTILQQWCLRPSGEPPKEVASFTMEPHNEVAMVPIRA
ncbi:MAG: cytochrome P450 [Chloroflexota bacterium]